MHALAGRGLGRIVRRGLGLAALLSMPLGTASAQAPPAAQPVPSAPTGTPASPAPAASTPAPRPPPAADDAARTKARALGYAGVEAYGDGDYTAASAKLEESFQLLPVPSLGLWSARALVGLGRWVEAERRYRSVAGLPIAAGDSPVQQRAKDEALYERAELLRRIPSLKVRAVGASLEAVTISVDGAPRDPGELATALLLDPGRHEIVGVLGRERSQVVLSLGERAHEEVELRFSGASPEPTAAASEAAVAAAASASAAAPGLMTPLPSPTGADATSDGTRQALRIGGWVAVGAGAAGLATSLVSYLIADRQYAGFERRALCVNGDCSRDEVDTYNDLRDIHRASLIAGGIAAAAGATLVVLTWGEPAEPRETVRLQLGPGSAALGGSF